MKSIFLSILLGTLYTLKAQKPALVVPNGHNAWISDFTVSSDGKYFATASYDNTIKLWQLDQKRELRTFYGHDNVVTAIAFSNSGKYLASADGQGDILIWDILTGKSIKTLSQYRFMPIKSLSFSPNDEYLASGSSDSTLLIYSFSLDSIIHLQGFSGGVAKVRFLPNNETVAVLDENEIGENSQLLYFNVKSGTFLDSLGYYYWHGDINDFSVSHNGKYIFNVVDTDSGQIRVHDIYQNIVKTRFNGHQSKIFSIVSSNNPDEFFTLSKSKNSVFTSDIEIKKWNWQKQVCIDSIKFNSPNAYINKAIFEPKTGQIITTEGASGLTFLNSKPLSVTGQTSQHTAIINNLFELKDGHLLLFSERGDLSVVNFKDAAILKKSYKIPQKDGALTGSISADSSELLFYEYSGSNLFSFHLNDGHINEVLAVDSAVSFWTLSPKNNLVAIFGKHPYNGRRRNASLKIVSLHEKKLLLDTTLFIGKTYEELHRFSRDEKMFIFSHLNTDSIFLYDISKRRYDYLYHTDSTYAGRVATNLCVLNDSLIAVTYRDKRGFLVWNINTKDIYHKADKLEMDIIELSYDSFHHLLYAKDWSGNLKVFTCLDFTELKSFSPAKSFISTETLSKSGNLLTTSSIDKTLRIVDYDNGNLLYSYIPFGSIDFVLLEPKGYYRATPAAAKFLYYVTPDLKVITFEQLDIKYNRPDLLLQAVGSKDTTLISSFRKAYEKRIRKLNIDTAAFGEGFGLPEADFANRDNINSKQDKQKLILHIKGGDKTYPLDRFNVWINETPLFGLRGISLRNKNRHQLDTTIVVTLSQGLNSLETSVTNVNGTESYRMPLTVTYTPAVPQKERLHFIGIGIDRFHDSGHNLNYSVKDIRDLAHGLKAKYKADILIDTLFNQQVTVENVAALKRKLLQTSVNDKVLLSYSGHGLLSKDYDYFLSTYPVNFRKPEEGGLPYELLEALLDSIPARKKLMLIDACHSGEVDKEEMQQYRIVMKEKAGQGLKGGEIINTDTTARVGMKNSFELMQELFVNVGHSTGATIIAAASGTQLAQERGELKNGVFTYAILEYMKKQPSGTVSELKRYVNKRVPELTNGLQIPVTRTETKQVNWKVW